MCKYCVILLLKPLSIAATCPLITESDQCRVPASSKRCKCHNRNGVAAIKPTEAERFCCTILSRVLSEKILENMARNR